MGRSKDPKKIYRSCIGEMDLPFNIEAQFVDTTIENNGPEYIYLGYKDKNYPHKTNSMRYIFVVPGYESKIGPLHRSIKKIPADGNLQKAMEDANVKYGEQGYSFSYGTLCPPIQDDELKKTLVDAVMKEELKIE